SRHHTPPQMLEISLGGLGPSALYEVVWSEPTLAAIRSSANRPEATRDGAYCIALATTDPLLGLVGYRRAEPNSGRDWELIPAGAPVPEDVHLDFDRDDLVMLEVSGIDRDTNTLMRQRLQDKVQQVTNGGYPWTAYATVVGFLTARVWLEKARD